MSAESLKEKMQEFAAGKVATMRVTGADLADAGKGKEEDGVARGSDGATKGTVETQVPDAAKRDVFANASAATDLHKGMMPSFIQPEKIDITDEDREAFLQAIVTGDRYERSFSLFGGKLKGVFRCRKVAESDGIIAWLTHCINAKKIDARIEYLTLMRDALLAAQVKSLRGLLNEDFPELPGPYCPTRSDDGSELKEPGWLGAASAWGARPEALVTALHNELQKFEQRYWAMVVEAGNQNFWNPAASI